MISMQLHDLSPIGWNGIVFEERGRRDLIFFRMTRIREKERERKVGFLNDVDELNIE